MCAPIDETTIAQWLSGQCLALDLWLEAVAADPMGDPDLAHRIETHRNWLADELLAICEERENVRNTPQRATG